MKKLEKLKETIDNTTWEKVEIEFPISLVEGKCFKIGEGKYFPMTPRGAAGMYNLVKSRYGKQAKNANAAICERFSYKSFTVLANAAEGCDGHFLMSARTYRDMLASHINAAHEAIAAFPIKKPIVALVYDGEIVGIVYDRYDFMSNDRVVEQVEYNGLDNNLHHWLLDEEKLDLHFRVDGTDGFITAIRVRNGHAGYHSFNYRVLVSSKDFEYIVPKKHFGKFDSEKNYQEVSQRNRHLSRVEETFAEMKSLFEQAGELNLIERLKEIDCNRLRVMLDRLVEEPTERQDEILGWATKFAAKGAIKNGLDLVNHVSGYMANRGYKSAVNGLLTPLFNELFEKNFVV
jgi:hypothetical protein